MAQRIVLSGSATIDPPKKFHKAQKSEISSMVTKRFGKTKYLSKTIQFSADKVYLIDDIVVFINSESMSRKPGFLKDRKLGFDDTYQNDKSYSSKIEAISGKDVLIMDMILEGLKMFNFTTTNSSEDFVVTGFVQYNLGEENKARTVLEDLIKGLKFE